jgi:hypothetical protein
MTKKATEYRMLKKLKIKLNGLSPQAKYTDETTIACQ